MFRLSADKCELLVLEKEILTSGSVNIHDVLFSFDEDWDGMDRIAVFRAGNQERSVVLDDTNKCVIPWEVLRTPRVSLYAGVCGTVGIEIVQPTIWAYLGIVQEGAESGELTTPPTPSIWQELLEQIRGKADDLQLVGNEYHLIANGVVIAKVPASTSGGSSSEIGVSYEIGHGLKVEENTLMVDAVSDFEGDNTLPATAALVQSTVGNIEILLATI